MNPVYASFAGGLDQAATGRLFNAYSIASQKQVPEIHLLFQTTGGNVSEGVVLYNFIRNFPIPTSIYNGGGVNSAGVILFCGAQHRYASAHATFLIHSTYLGNVSAAHSGILYGLADSIALDDERTNRNPARTLEAAGRKLGCPSIQSRRVLRGAASARIRPNSRN
jgi:hypothetical protein